MGAGQSAAAAFRDEGQARHHVATWRRDNDPADCRFVALSVADARRATVRELKAAGLDEWLGDMEMEERLAPTTGGVA